MDLLARFEQYIAAQRLCKKEKDRLLVAVSGGKDSILLLNLLVQAGYQVGVAHCNFQLRGADSDLDEALVRDYAAQLGVPCFVKHFDTQGYAAQEKISIQMAARDLRYAWFDALAEEEGYDYIAVAHHATDNVETVLINMLRGTGIRGLCGMPVQRGRVIRPMLFMSSTEVTEAIAAYELSYRDDASNFSADYMRNKIRLEVLPVLREINPSLEDTLMQDMDALRDVYSFMDSQLDTLRSRFFVKQREGWTLDLSALMGQQPLNLVLYELLRPFEFSAAVCRDLADVLQRSAENTRSGLQFASPAYMLILDREQARLIPVGAVDQADLISGWITLESPNFVWEIPQQQSLRQVEIRAQVSPQNEMLNSQRTSANQAAFDADLVAFPLHIRTWRQGDRFKPLGMEGKSRKLSDLFVSLKIPRWEKGLIPVITDANDVIIWVAPYRMSMEYKITDKTINVLTLSYFCEDGRETNFSGESISG